MQNEIFLGKYQAHRLLGEGGMGRVFLGRQLDDGKPVVIKLMHDHLAQNPRFRQAFQREMRLMTRFRHPYAVTLYDCTKSSDEVPCIVMEFIDGITLGELVEKHGSLPAPRVGRILGQICQVLQGAHINGIIHRDLTPVNVMLSKADTLQETVKVMDFGLARMGIGPYIPLEKLMGESGTIGGGTPDFVPPEQVRGEDVDHRGDIYSLGVLLYKCLTGYLPFEHATTTEDILHAHLETKPPTFAAMHAGHVPRSVEQVVQNCLKKHPSERPQTALALAADFSRALGQQIIRGNPIPATMLPGEDLVFDRIDPKTVMDHLEAWMPEPIAVIKLRGFVQDMGGEFLESEPGMIRFRLNDPDNPPPQPKSLFQMFGFGSKVITPTEHVILELRMEKSEDRPNLLLISVIMRPEHRSEKLNDPQWRKWCNLVCRELRSYLMSN